MQTITVTVRQQGGNTALQIGSKVIATIGKDRNNIGRYSASFMSGQFGCCDNHTYPEAVEFISGAIERHFADFGLNVKFV